MVSGTNEIKLYNFSSLDIRMVLGFNCSFHLSKVWATHPDQGSDRRESSNFTGYQCNLSVMKKHKGGQISVKGVVDGDKRRGGGWDGHFR